MSERWEAFINSELDRFAYLDIVDDELAFELDGPCIPVRSSRHKGVLSDAMIELLEYLAGGMDAEEHATQFYYYQLLEQDGKMSWKQLRDLYSDVSDCEFNIDDWGYQKEWDKWSFSDADCDAQINFALRSYHRSTQACKRKIRKLVESKYVRFSESVL